MLLKIYEWGVFLDRYIPLQFGIKWTKFGPQMDHICYDDVQLFNHLLRCILALWIYGFKCHAFSHFTCLTQTTEQERQNEVRWLFSVVWKSPPRCHGSVFKSQPGRSWKIKKDLSPTSSLLCWSLTFTPTGSRAPSPYTDADAGGRRAHWSTRRRTGPGIRAGLGTCTWGRGSQTAPRCPRRPGWRSGRSRDRSRGGRMRGASGGPRRRCNTGSEAGRGLVTGSRSGSCSPSCRPGWSSIWWETWGRGK